MLNLFLPHYLNKDFEENGTIIAKKVVPLQPIYTSALPKKSTDVPLGRYRKSGMNALSNASIQDEDCEGLASFVLPEAKSSQTGVSVRYVHHQSNSLVFL